MNRLMNIIAALVLGALSFTVNAEHPSSFSKAKKLLDSEIYTDHKLTFYCGCTYAPQLKENGKGKRLTPEHESCGFSPRKQEKRAARVEWEHVMPAHHFGQHLACWREGGRKNCKKDATFKAMESDMHNLVPAIGEVNGDRSNYKYGMIEGEERVYGKCDAEVDFKAERFEPSPQIYGDIARIYFYMSERYNINLSKQQRQLFIAWDKLDPVDDWELERDKRIMEVQGNSNPYVAGQKAKMLKDERIDEARRVRDEMIEAIAREKVKADADKG